MDIKRDAQRNQKLTTSSEKINEEINQKLQEASLKPQLEKLKLEKLMEGEVSEVVGGKYSLEIGEYREVWEVAGREEYGKKIGEYIRGEWG